MISALASADATAWLSVLVKTLAYAATLFAAGSVLVSAGLRELTEDGRVSLRRMAVIGALAAAVLSGLRVPVRTSFLMGGSIGGATDPMMLGTVAGSPLGASVETHALRRCARSCGAEQGAADAGVVCGGARGRMASASVHRCGKRACPGHSRDDSSPDDSDVAAEWTGEYRATATNDGANRRKRFRRVPSLWRAASWVACAVP